MSISSFLLNPTERQERFLPGRVEQNADRGWPQAKDGRVLTMLVPLAVSQPQERTLAWGQRGKRPRGHVAHGLTLIRRRRRVGDRVDRIVIPLVVGGSST